ncbi:hypothetical protein DAPPUDRAFT_259600 [Daphnia pulex]|uniref:Uncharacterized protein n=1 Tax=Daphnia pulex TaxID=6669 RepID=E9HHH5_DAPPU|nr:hypothetical protein DAPPUDRAFT_259600 [Daphnia pulex]|eukprot:EFX68779.1 hypothetical protein DAPPUDRAFT_259600 [Daphnia pulex]
MMIDLLARHQAKQKSNPKLRDKAVQSAVRPEIQPIEGEDLHVGHRWAFSPDKSTAHEDQSDEASSSNNSSVTPRPKLWQRQAFNTDGSGVSSPHPYPLTQFLKVRNLFDAEVFTGPGLATGTILVANLPLELARARIGYWNWLPILVANLPLELARARIGYWNWLPILVDNHPSHSMMMTHGSGGSTHHPPR